MRHTQILEVAQMLEVASAYGMLTAPPKVDLLGLLCCPL
jgi:hypothetical protein